MAFSWRLSLPSSLPLSLPLPLSFPPLPSPSLFCSSGNIIRFALDVSWQVFAKMDHRRGLDIRQTWPEHKCCYPFQFFSRCTFSLFLVLSLNYWVRKANALFKGSGVWNLTLYEHKAHVMMSLMYSCVSSFVLLIMTPRCIQHAQIRWSVGVVYGAHY